MTLWLLQPLVTMNNADVYMGIQISVGVPAFNSLGNIPKSIIASHKVILSLIFWGTAIPFSIGAAPFYILTNRA